MMCISINYNNLDENEEREKTPIPVTKIFFFITKSLELRTLNPKYMYIIFKVY